MLFCTFFFYYFSVCDLIDKEDVIGVFGINLDGGDSISPSTNGYLGDLTASILNYLGIPFIQVAQA